MYFPQRKVFAGGVERKVKSLGDWVFNDIWTYYTSSRRKMPNKVHVLDSPFFRLIFGKYQLIWSKKDYV